MKLSGGRTIALGGDFPENICLGAIVLVEIVHRAIVRGGNCPRRELSGGQLTRGQ